MTAAPDERTLLFYCDIHSISLEAKKNEFYATNLNLYEQGTRSIGWRTVSTPAAKITLEEKTR